MRRNNKWRSDADVIYYYYLFVVVMGRVPRRTFCELLWGWWECSRVSSYVVVLVGEVNTLFMGNGAVC